ncbi:MAG TPA: hypothetical protein GX405_19885 [Rhizobiales bacterium]|nr:hypothetical protein [Hyphomicrobiales bacterium]
MDGGMDGRNERMLLKIAALLVSLSLVAERAAGRSLPVRFLVLSILGQAEAIARAFVLRETQIDWPDWTALADAPEFCGHPADAASLALRLRLLAVMLADVVEAGCLAASDETCAGVAPYVPATILLLIMPGRRRRYAVAYRPWDTS